MIKSNVPAFCELRGTKKAIVQIEIESYSSTPEGTTYIVNDYEMSGTEESGVVKKLIHTKSVFYATEKINGLDQYLESINDYSGLSKIEIDWLKIKQGLLIDTQTNLYEDGLTIYRLNPENWVLC